MLTVAEWQARAAEHLMRVRRWTVPRRERRARGESHPVHDFLFQYYGYAPGKLERWHPDPGETLEEGGDAHERFTAPVYRSDDGVIVRDLRALGATERAALEKTRDVLIGTRERPANFGCYGMHEWAMVYGGHDVRHATIAPLRLSQSETDAFVESRPIVCTHLDAFRFFAPAAQPLNRITLSWEARYAAEQPGCIHANMDLYRWAYTSMPWIGSDILWRSFALAADLRTLDMQASPYDLRAFGFDTVPIETPEGRAEYQRRQRDLSARASVLRDAMIDSLSGVLSS